MKKVSLFISPAENRPNHFVVAVVGEGFSESVGNNVGARIRGADVFLDDNLFGMGGFGLERVNSFGQFRLAKTVHSSLLDEDWGKDEIYAIVEVEGLDGTFKTNTIEGNF